MIQQFGGQDRQSKGGIIKVGRGTQVFDDTRKSSYTGITGHIYYPYVNGQFIPPESSITGYNHELSGQYREIDYYV